MSRSKRRGIAQDTLAKLEQGYYINALSEWVNFKTEQETALANTILYRPEDADKLLENHTTQPIEVKTAFEAINETTLDAVRRLVKEGEEQILCLNFASAKNPGGGFLGGSRAQEESIARATGLYPCLLKCRPYYDANRPTTDGLYTDHMIYAPNVPVIKYENGDLMEQVALVSIITAPAVNAGVVRRRTKKNHKLIEPTMRRRIAKVLAIAQEHGHQVLVLGAWGCGVFQNDPELVAQWFEDALEGAFKNQFKRVVFAVYAKDEHKFLRPFAKRFG